MNIRAFISRHSALALALVIGAAAASAQGYYDDDIYYDAAKAKKERKTDPRTAKRQQQQYQGQYYYDGAAYVPWNNVGDYQAADYYTSHAQGGSNRDVDEYNRRTPAKGAQAQGQMPDSISLEQFEQMSATRNLARFHDSKVAQDAYTDNAIDDPNYYLSQGADGSMYLGAGANQRPINVNVYNGYPYDPFGWNYPYYSSYYSPWAWGHYGYPYYGYPYYGWGYDPYWAWNWGPSWGPSWSWGWGPSWGYPGHWGHNHWGYPVWGGGVAHNRTSSGAWAPNRASASNGSYNRGNGGVRGNGAYNSSPRGSMANSAGVRGSAAGSGAVRGNQATVRPGYRQPTYDPSGTVSNGYTGTRGRAGYGTSGNSYRPSATPSKSSGSSWNNSSSGATRGRSSYSSGSSSGSWSSGSSSRGSSGGSGSFGGGGGATRGRGR